MDTTSADSPQPALHYDGRIGELYRIFLINLLLTIVTLGIFRFWAITRYRRYFWSHMRFLETRFEYTGRGKELFLGFLLAIAILVGLIIGGILLAFLVGLVSPALAFVPVVAVYITLFILFGAAHFSAQRYRLSRTQWRGIRGGMRGSALAYGAWSLLYTVLLPLTLLQIVPFMTVRLAERRINASRFGDLAFNFRGRAGRLYLSYLVAMVGSLVLLGVVAVAVFGSVGSQLVPVFTGAVQSPRAEIMVQRAMPVIAIGLLVFSVGSGLILCWYWAAVARHIMGNTTLDGIRFSSSVRGGSLLWLTAANGVIALITLGFGLPIVLHRTMRYLAHNLLVSGMLDVAVIHQSSLPLSRTGEGMLNALDPSAGIF